MEYESMYATGASAGDGGLEVDSDRVDAVGDSAEDR